ncbi:response regulator [Streptomyces sp. NPDC059166]|uniref:response regulator n=1 Tax=Streptomyces sp. NPDC059166 TaxID=3346752 RepID=UPI0036854CF4
MSDNTPPAASQNWAARSHAPQNAPSQALPSQPDQSSSAFPADPFTGPAREQMPPLPASRAGFHPIAPLRVVVADDNPVVRAGLGVLLSGRADIEVVAEAADGRQAYDEAVRYRPDVVLLDVRMPGVDGISALPHLVQVAPVMMLTYSRESEVVHEALRLGASGYLVHGEFTADQLVQAVRDTREGRAHFTATAANALLAHMRQGPTPSGQALPDGLGTALTAGHAHRAIDVGGLLPSGPHQGPPVGPQPVRRPAGNPQGLSHMQPVVAQSSFDGGSSPGREPNKAQFGLSSREVEVMELISSGMSNQQIAATCFISEKTVKNHINRIFTKLHSSSRSEAIARWLGTAPSKGPDAGGAGSHG